MATQVLEKTAAKTQQTKKSVPKGTKQTKSKASAKTNQGAADTTTQMNVRLGKTLHEEGNAAFASIGVSPSEAVRALWEKAAKRGEELEEIRKLLFPADNKTVQQNLALLEEGQSIVRNGMAQLGIDIDKLPLDTRTYEEVRDEMYAEMLKEMGY